jgi:transcriptional regulator with XRE-family HTH domain
MITVQGKLISVDDLATSLGEQLRAERVRQRLDQTDLAKAAGVTRAVVSRLENGAGGNVHSLVAVVRALGRTGWLESLKPAITVRPMELIRSPRPPMQRVRKRKDDETPTSSV